MTLRILAAAGVLASLCAPAPTRADENSAAAAMTKLGGVVTRDEGKPGKPVTEVSFQASTTGHKVTDKDLKPVAELKNLKVLYLGYVTDTSDAGLVYLQGLTHLEKLTLPETRVTDRGLARLSRLGSMKSLGLLGCKGITDRGLPQLYGLKKLVELNLSGTRVTDRGVAALQKALPNVYVIR